MNKTIKIASILVVGGIITWLSLDKNLDLFGAVLYPTKGGGSSFTNLTEQAQSDTALTNFFVSGQLWLSNGLYSVGAAAGQLTLNSGTGLGGFTNYAGGLYQSNSAASGQPQTYLSTNGDLTLGNDLFSPNIQGYKVIVGGALGKVTTTNTPIVFMVSNTVAGGSAIVMTNGTLQVSNVASTPGQVISSTNVFQVDASQLGKAIQVDTNGNDFIKGVLTSQSANGGFAWGSAATIVTLTNVVYTNVTLNFPSTSAQSFSDLLVNVANLKSNDTATINAPAISQTNGIFSAWISNTFLYARYHNYAATAIDPASGIFNMQVFQYK